MLTLSTKAQPKTGGKGLKVAQNKQLRNQELQLSHLSSSSNSSRKKLGCLNSLSKEKTKKVVCLKIHLEVNGSWYN
jgi:hypothetical protein